MRQPKQQQSQQPTHVGGILRFGFGSLIFIAFAVLMLWPGTTLASPESPSKLRQAVPSAESEHPRRSSELHLQKPVETSKEEDKKTDSAKGNKAEPLPEADADVEQADMYGVVLAVKNVQDALHEGVLLKPIEGEETIQRVKVRVVSSGPAPGFKNRVITVDNVLGENPAYNIPLKPGVRVLLNVEKNLSTGKWVFYIANRDRTPAIMILGALFVMAVLVLGGQEVCKHALLVALILIGCYKALFPAVLAGTTGANWILLMCFMYTILASFIYQVPGTKSFSREQSVVILGTLGGLLILLSILWIMHEITPLDGYSNEGLAAIWYQSPQMDYWTFFLSGALIGYQGLLFHLCWSLSQNRRQEDEQLGFNQRFQLVMLRGRRLLGPLLSSVGLLFLGILMPILLQLQGTPTAQFVNLESTASMLCFVFAGGLTLILTVPLTALISAWMLSPRPAQVSAGTTQTD